MARSGNLVKGRENGSKGQFKVIAISGTPGTGKTRLAKELSLLLRYVYVDVNLLVKDACLSEGYDRERKSEIVDTERLNKALIRLINGLKRASERGAVIDSHMSHFLSSKLVDICIITRCSLKTLKRRLEAKGYGKAKVRENLDAEIFEVCLTEAQGLGHRILVVDTEKSFKETGNSAMRKIKRVLKFSKNPENIQ